MTIYIKWPRSIDKDFRTAYAQIVQETIQDTPITKGEIYVVGSGRITQEHIKIISQSFPDVQFIKGEDAVIEEVSDDTRI